MLVGAPLPFLIDWQIKNMIKHFRGCHEFAFRHYLSVVPLLFHLADFLGKICGWNVSLVCCVVEASWELVVVSAAAVVLTIPVHSIAVGSAQF